MPSERLPKILNYPARRDTLLTARIVGRTLLSQSLLDSGLSAQETDAAIPTIIDAATRSPPHLATGDLTELLDHLDQALSGKDNLGINYPALVTRAGDIALKDISLTGAGSEIAEVVRAVTLGLALLLCIAKLEGKFDWGSREGHIGLAAGIPTGFRELAESLSDAVRASLSKGGRPDKRDDQDHKAPEKRVAPPASLKGRSQVHRIAATSSYLSYQDAIAKRDEAVRFLCGNSGDPFERFGVQRDGATRRIAQFATNWPSERSSMLGIGLLPVWNGDMAANAATRYRIAIRVQAEREPRIDILNKIVDALRATLDPKNEDYFSIRWTGPVATLASNPTGALTPWSGPKRRTPTIGSPIAIAGGSVSAVTLHLRKSDMNFLLTTGHSLHDDDGRGTPGTFVYSPPQPFGHDAREASLIGAINQLATLEPLDMMASLRGAEPLGHDYALVLVRPQFTAHKAERLVSDRRALSAELFRGLEANRASPLTFNKSAARTPTATGTMTAQNVRLEMYDSLRNRMVVAGGLIEVTLPNTSRLEPGDSGALLYTEHDGKLLPAAMIIAGARAGHVSDKRVTTTERICYAQPLALLPGLADMEIG